MSTTDLRSVSSPVPKFLYAVMAPGRIPAALDRDLVQAGREVIVLSYRRAVAGQIFLPFSTWTEGRNRLFLEARRRCFDYLVLLDDDIRLELTSFAPMPEINPWDLLEQLVHTHLPAIAIPDYWWYPKAVRPLESVARFDACATFIDCHAAESLLPYDDSLDDLSWFCSQEYLAHLAVLLYPGHVLRLNAVRAINQHSRPYPRGLPWDRMNQHFALSLRAGHREAFRPFPRTDSIDIRAARPASYRIDRVEIAAVFDLNAVSWQRRARIQEQAGRRAPRISKSPLAALGDILQQRWGPHIANGGFALPALVRTLRMRVQHRRWRLGYRLKFLAYRLSPQFYLRIRTALGRRGRHPFQDA